MEEDSNKKKYVKRSSLKGIEPLTSKDLHSLKDNRRHSVSWNVNLVGCQKIKDIRTSFKELNLQNEQDRKEAEEKKKKFLDERKKSLKNEYTLVKDFLKNAKIEEEDDEQLKEAELNTKKNIEIGKIDEDESDSKSDNSDN